MGSYAKQCGTSFDFMIFQKEGGDAMNFLSFHTIMLANRFFCKVFVKMSRFVIDMKLTKSVYNSHKINR